jgi:NADPH-dependent ferric siderophore reductase
MSRRVDVTPARERRVFPALTGVADVISWGGGEALAMRHVRRHLREDGGIPAAAVSVLGYWKHRDTETWE